MKKKILIFIILVALIVLCDSLYSYISSNSNILKGYYKKDDYSESHAYRDYADFYKYYYTSNEDDEFDKDNTYQKVKNEDIENIKKYFDKFKRLMEAGGRIEDFDFDEKIIDENDYFIIYDIGDQSEMKIYSRFDVFFYDTDTHVLYVISVST